MRNLLLLIIAIAHVINVGVHASECIIRGCKTKDGRCHGNSDDILYSHNFAVEDCADKCREAFEGLRNSADYRLPYENYKGCQFTLVETSVGIFVVLCGASICCCLGTRVCRSRRRAAGEDTADEGENTDRAERAAQRREALLPVAEAFDMSDEDFAHIREHNIDMPLALAKGLAEEEAEQREEGQEEEEEDDDEAGGGGDGGGGHALTQV